jgi:hypothetical protein
MIKSEYNHKYYLEHKEAVTNKNRNWEKLHPDSSFKFSREYRINHPGIAAKQSKRYRLDTRRECLEHYSNGTPKCACCGETHIEFLGIDHINGGGAKARKELGHGNIGASLKAQGYPLGYRVLCHNCNMSIGFYGYCPHQIKEKSDG